jgi:hypothetical protein
VKSKCIERRANIPTLLFIFLGAIACAFSFRIPLSHADIASNLVGYWALNETSGASAADSSGSADTGTVTGTADWVSGKFNNAFSFDGSSYIDVSRPVEDDFTMCAWFKTTGAGGGDIHFDLMQILDSEIQGTSDGDFGFGIDSVGRLAYGSGGGSSLDETVVKTAGAVNDDAWHHGCVTRSATSGDVDLYLDGSLADSGTWVTGSLNGNPTLRIGGFQDLGTAGANFVGQLDDVRTYSRILSDAEITALYQLDPTIRETQVSSTRVQSAGLPWCSGPSAPGWNMNLPGGGCSNTAGAATPALLIPDVASSSDSEVSSRTALLRELQRQLVALLAQELALLQGLSQRAS